MGVSIYGEVEYDVIWRDEWCEVAELGTAEKAKVELAIYRKAGKMGLIQLTQEWGWVVEYLLSEEVVPCIYEEIAFLHTAEGTHLLVTQRKKEGEKRSVLALSVSPAGGYQYVSYREIFPCAYDKIRYRGGYAPDFLLYDRDTVMKYNFLTKETTLEMRHEK